MKKENGNTNLIKGWLELFVLLFLLWIILSGIFELKMILLGVFSAAVAASLCVKTLIVKGLKTDNTYFLIHVHPGRFFLYVCWLLKEIVNSALYVAKVAVFRIDDIDPAFIRFKADYDNPLARSTLTDSITLTPGTITVNVDADGIYTVHGLTEEVRESLLEGGMQRKVAWLFGEEIDYVPMEHYLERPLSPGGITLAQVEDRSTAGKSYRVKAKRKIKEL